MLDARQNHIFEFLLYRVVKQNCQVVRFRDFEHMRARMAQLFCKSSRHNIYLLIQSKKIEVKGQDLSKILKKAKNVWFALCPWKVRYISHLWAKIKYLKSAVIPIFKLNLSRYESDLSNEVLCSLVAQRAAKLLEVKVADLGKNHLTNQVRLEKVGTGVK